VIMKHLSLLHLYLKENKILYVIICNTISLSLCVHCNITFVHVAGLLFIPAFLQYCSNTVLPALKLGYTRTHAHSTLIVLTHCIISVQCNFFQLLLRL
jgi:hypothetical protein